MDAGALVADLKRVEDGTVVRKREPLVLDGEVGDFFEKREDVNAPVLGGVAGALAKRLVLVLKIELEEAVEDWYA